jgi:hypothetical protein
MSGYLKIAKLDFLTIKSQLSLFFPLLMMLVMFGIMGSTFTIMSFLGAGFIALLATHIFSVQEKNNLDRFYGSVSVNLSDIVLGRYFFVICQYVSVVGVVTLIHICSAFFHNTTFGFFDFMLGFSFSFFIFAFIIGIILPVFFKMGYTKAKIWALIPILAVSILFGISPFVSFLREIIELVQSNQSVLIIGSLTAGCIILLISYKLAVIAYRKRKYL